MPTATTERTSIYSNIPRQSIFDRWSLTIQAVRSILGKVQPLAIEMGEAGQVTTVELEPRDFRKLCKGRKVEYERLADQTEMKCYWGGTPKQASTLVFVAFDEASRKVGEEWEEVL